jgi:hypothetical protein
LLNWNRILSQSIRSYPVFTKFRAICPVPGKRQRRQQNWSSCCMGIPEYIIMILLQGRVPFIMPNALGNTDSGYLLPKCPIHSRNPPEVDSPINDPD